MDRPDLLRLDAQLCFPLYAAARAMVQAYQPLLAELGLTYPQYLAMLALWERDGQSVKALGEQLYLDSGTLTPLLKRLEGQGLVERRRGSPDGRVVTLWLTAEGRKLKRKAAQVPHALACRLGLTPERAARLRTDLKGLFELIKRGAEPQPGDEP